MATLDSGLTKEDLETLVEAMGDWETIGNHEYHAMNMVRQVAMPSEDHDSYEFIKSLKDHFKKREKEIKDTRSIRQEKAIFLKAKLMLILRDQGITQLFETASQPIVERTPAVASTPTPVDAFKEQWEVAEEYIRDMGVWEYYQKFLADRKNAEMRS